jgi:hypothetical protein
MNETQHRTRRQLAFARFKALHPRYHGGFLQDSFVDEVVDALGLSHTDYVFRIDPEDERWDRVCPPGTEARR